MTAAPEERSPVLARDAIFLGREATDMADAIDFVGGELVERGIVGEPYVDSMKHRETVVSTYLGNGVALPHGTFEGKDEIRGTALVIGQYPQGVPWGNGGEKAHLVIGLAAMGEDHVDVLAQIADVLQDEELCRTLWTTTDADLVFETLAGNDVGGGTDSEATRQVTILNPAGLHARPAALIVEKASEAESETIQIIKNGKTANARSVMSVLALGAATGDAVTLFASGSDSESIVEDIAQIMLSEVET